MDLEAAGPRATVVAADGALPPAVTIMAGAAPPAAGQASVRWQDDDGGLKSGAIDLEEASGAARRTSIGTTVRLERAASMAAGQSTASAMFIAFRNLSYTIQKGKEELHLLKDVSAYFMPGRVAALMGPSGAGKTTLLDAIAGRKTVGKLTTDALVFGNKRASRGFLKRRAGYVEQFDTLVDLLTVEEMLMYTAELKRPESESRADKQLVVDELLGKLGLLHIRSSRIGNPMARGISGGQAKRVNIGIALVTEPKILFLDEPTTGLDSSTAEDIMALVKKLALSQRYTVVSTIHSPSTRTFRSFDDLLLLSRGRMVFFGPLEEFGPQRYFEKLGCHPDPKEAASKRFNVAEWIIAITGGGTKGVAEGGVDFPAEYERSSLKADAEANLELLLPPGGSDAALPRHREDSETATSIFKGMRTFFMYRSLRNYTNGDFMGPRVGEKFMLAFVIFSLYLGVASKTDPASVQTTAAVLFLLCGMMAFGAVAFVPTLFVEKKLFTRERNDGCYLAVTYVAAKLFEEALPAAVGAMIFLGSVYWAIGFQGSFGLFYLVVFLTGMCGISLAYFMAALAPTMELANVSMIAISVTGMFFVGLLILEVSIPNYWAWFRYFAFFRYSWRALMVDHFTGAGDPLLFPGNGAFSSVLQFYNLAGGESAWTNVGALAAFTGGSMVLAWLGMAYVKHEQR